MDVWFMVLVILEAFFRHALGENIRLLWVLSSPSAVCMKTAHLWNFGSMSKRHARGRLSDGP